MGAIRAILAYAADGQAQGAAETVITQARARIVAAEARRAGDVAFLRLLRWV